MTSDGYIVTNSMLSAITKEIKFDGNNYTAQKVWADSSLDMAKIVYKIDAKNLPAVTLGDSDNLRWAQWPLLTEAILWGFSLNNHL